MPLNFWIFLLFCFPIRVFLILGVYFIIENQILNKDYFVVAAALVSFGFFFAEFRGNEKGFFGGKRYWPSAIHGFFYAILAVFLELNSDASYVILIIDLVYGTLIFVANYVDCE